MYHTAHGATPDSAPAPPQLDGYEYRGTLGSGSTATVYRYLQHGTNREVAVKVSTARLDPKAGARFRTEANFMAKLSAHPYILSIYGAGITADGRSYIVFEYAPGGNLKDLLATRRFDAEETLDIGVNLASALATAHRNGIVHRDIKTSNVLITEQGLPALADFGISSSLARTSASDVLAMSIPWSAPEVVTEHTGGTIASEVWSLGATVYSLLAGHSPFERREKGQNTRELMRRRIERATFVPISRTDVPDALQQVLATAMTRDPDRRYRSAREFGEAVRAVQQAEGLAPTPLEVPAAEWMPTVGGVDFSDSSARGPVRSHVVHEGRRAVAPAQETVRRRRDEDTDVTTEPPQRRTWVWVLVSVVVAVAAAGAAVAAWVVAF